MRGIPTASPSEIPSLIELIERTATAAAVRAAEIAFERIRLNPPPLPAWLSLQETAVYCGYSEAQMCNFVKAGIGPKSVLFSKSARRFKRSDVDAWCAAGGPSQFRKRDGK